MDIKTKLNGIYQSLQTLHIPSTKGNLETILKALYDIEEISASLNGGAENGTEDGPADHPE